MNKELKKLLYEMVKEKTEKRMVKLQNTIKDLFIPDNWSLDEELQYKFALPQDYIDAVIHSEYKSALERLKQNLLKQAIGE